MAATAASIALAYRANEDRKAANQQKSRLSQAECLAADQRDRARQGEEMAIDVVWHYGDLVRDTPELKNNPALENLRKRLLKEA